MIESISIRNLGVIESASLNLGPGFTALTGETGAGKTMVLTALQLILGGRGDSGAVRAGAQQLFVEGCWRVTDSELIARVTELGASVEAGELLVNRSVSAEGRSRAAISGASVPVGVLSEIAESLVAVHGQSDQLRLRSTTAQRVALDSFGGAAVAGAAADYLLAFQAHSETARRLLRLQNATDSDTARAAVIREFLQELEQLAPGAEEDEELNQRISRLSNFEGLRSAAIQAHDSISSENSDFDALTLVGLARKSIETVDDAVLQELVTRLRAIGSQLSDVSVELSSFLSMLDADPNQLEQLQNRRAALTAFMRKHGAAMAELLARGPAWLAELQELDSGEDQLAGLEQQLALQLATLAAAAQKLTEARREAAFGLSGQTQAELAALAMPGARLEVAVTPLADFETSGKDRVEFLLAAHPGAEPRPLSKGASGGELSRIMLAIELVLAGDNPLPTLIFDEVDAGVGGQAALELGRRLKKLAESTQVIVVTHLPQVAAFADLQLRVQKNSSGGFTTSSVETLQGEDRVQELARMLSGNSDSAVAVAHARELLTQK